MEPSPPKLVQASAHFSVFPALPYWYVACESSELGQKPHSVMLWDTPLVLFRDSQGIAHALLDRCSHRNVPLSTGLCLGDTIQCPYHGWQFDGSGSCTLIPALATAPTSKASQVPSYPVCEQEGYIWVFTDRTQAPNHQPYSLPFVDDPRYLTIRYDAEFEASLHATAENVLDVPHTAFLHAGLFRGGEPNPIETEVRRYFDRAECHYIGEPRPSGMLGKIMAPGGGEVVHIDSFILPSIAQVEYQLGDGIHLITTSCLSPISAFRTRMNAVVTVRVGKWANVLRPVVTPFALKIVEQDVRILSAQTQAIHTFGGENYAHSKADLLGPSIVKLLKKAGGTQVPIASDSPTGEPEAVSTGKIIV